MTDIADFPRSRLSLARVRSLSDTIMGSRNMLEKQISSLKLEEDELIQYLAEAEDVKPVLASMFESSSGPFLRESERALTNAVEGIIGDGSAIGIEANTLRNKMIARIGTIVNVASKKNEDTNRVLRSIFDSEGGALTNIIAFCLRAISTARSGQRRLLVIDEPDCWMSNENVKPFFQMVADMARLGGFQIIALTHHLDSIKELLDESNVIRILREDEHDADGNPVRRGKAQLVHKDSTPEHEDSSNYLSSVTLRNFNGHDSSEFVLAPGMNFIVGENNVGKSRILRALRCVALGLGEDADISSFKDSKGREKFARHADVMIELASIQNGQKTPLKQIHWRRNLKGSPAETWEMYSFTNGTLNKKPDTSNDGEICSVSKGRGLEAPSWIRSSEGLDIRPLTDEALCPQLHLQKVPSFALDKPDRILGELLAIGEKAARIKEMMRIHAENISSKNRELKEVKARIDTLSEELNKTAFILRVKQSIDTAEALNTLIEKQNAVIADVCRIFKEYQSTSEKNQNISEVFGSISIEDPKIVETASARNIFINHEQARLAEKNLSGVISGIKIEEPDIKALDVMASLCREHEKLSAKEAICSDIFSRMPEIEDHEAIQQAISETSRVRKIMEEGRSLKTRWSRGRNVLNQLLEEKALNEENAIALTCASQNEARRIFLASQQVEQRIVEIERLSLKLDIASDATDIETRTARFRNMETLFSDLSTTNEKLRQLQEEDRKLAEEERNLIAQMPDLCPTCGQRTEHHVH